MDRVVRSHVLMQIPDAQSALAGPSRPSRSSSSLLSASARFVAETATADSSSPRERTSLLTNPFSTTGRLGSYANTRTREFQMYIF